MASKGGLKTHTRMQVPVVEIDELLATAEKGEPDVKQIQRTADKEAQAK